MTIEWKPEYSVKVEEIDDQHKQLVSLFDKLYVIINENKNKDEVGVILEELKKFALVHFATEEKHFKECDFELAEEHIKEHKKFNKKIDEMIADFENNKLEVSFKLVDFLEDWLLDHLIEQDQKYVECFQKLGLK